MSHDSSGPRRVAPLLEQLGVSVWDPERYVIVTDHYLPANDGDSQTIIRFTRDWVKREGIRHFHDGIGICHTVLPEQGHLKPGMLAVGGDSHSPTGGAFGAYMFGVGATEMLGVLVTGKIWLRVPATIRIEWQGRFGAGVCAKDAMLHLCGQLGMDGGQYQAVEYAGEAISALSMQERMTMANMTAEFGGQAGLIAPDATTLAYLGGVGVTDAVVAPWFSDADAPLLAHHCFDATALAPQVAAPFSPANTDDVGNYRSERIEIAYIGACTGAKLDDLRMAARVLKGRKVPTGVTLMVAPSALRDQQLAEREGTRGLLLDAGATLLANSCGACAGYGDHRFGENARVISSTARNFKGRMGAASAEVFLASPYTVAASALAGRIADPRPYLEQNT
jgi:3-isopropylmalate/(R)-2-methylmalate dehydratase large subunit